MKRVRLEGGLEISALNAADAAVLHRQIFMNGAYDGHGISLRDGDCVFDVGANVGLASLWFASRNKGLRLFAIEPIPAVFEALSQNVKGELMQCALGDRPGTAKLQYDPILSSTGTLVPSTPAPLGDWARAASTDLGVPRPVAFAGMVALRLAQRLTRRTVEVRVRTLSEVIAEHRVERIDLLKVDVEGAEAAVLAGISEEDWPKIQQAIVETADAEAISATLRARGFQVQVDQEPWETFRMLGLHNVYATRS